MSNEYHLTDYPVCPHCSYVEYEPFFLPDADNKCRACGEGFWIQEHKEPSHWSTFKVIPMTFLPSKVGDEVTSMDYEEDDK